MRCNAVILAGSRKGRRDAMERAAHVDHKGVMPILGHPMIKWVIEALRESPLVESITLSAGTSKKLEEASGNIPRIKTGRSPSDSVSQALKALGSPLLITTSDHPLLQAKWIEQLVNEAEGTCDLAIGVATRDAILRDVPTTKRTFIRLADISFSGCNLFYAVTPKAGEVVRLWQKIDQNRKKPWRLAFGIGWPVLWDVVRHRLTEARLVEHITNLTGATIKFVKIDDGRAAVDVDKPSDLILVEHLLTLGSVKSA